VPEENQMKTSGNTVLITGGGSVIGLALAETLLHRDNEVIICGRRRERLQKAKSRNPGLHIRVCDVSRPASRRTFVGWLMSEFKALNLLVNNAGIQRPFDFLKGARDLASADEEIATNLAAPLHMSTLMIPYLRRKQKAAIVNISSGLAFTPLAAVPVYCATKAAIHSLCLTMRRQLQETSVRVFEIAPPIVATELSGRRRRPDGDEDIMLAEEVAMGILEALEQDNYEVALGSAANLHRMREGLFSAINA
jgi:uncharacterized oxidoreductase